MKTTNRKFETGPLQVNTWVIPLQKGSAAVIDPGGASAALIHFLQETAVRHIEIMLTHGHFDHIGGIPALIQQFPDYALYIHKEDAYRLQKPKKSSSPEFADIITMYLGENWQDSIPEPTGFFAEGDTVNGLTVLHTPGHTRGSVCLWKEDENTLYSGDTLFFRSYGRTDLEGGSDTEMCRSLKRLLTTLPAATVVHPGHGGSTSIGDEKKVQWFS